LPHHRNKEIIMSTTDYIIVGAEVGEETHYVDAANNIHPDAAPGRVPLNVEYIGSLMVRLSELGQGNVSPDEKRAHEKAVRHALQVREAPGVGGAMMSDAEKAEILKETTVNIVFEDRTETEGQTDVNTRILVVPADGTLQRKAEELGGKPTVPGFDPPLSYELDQKLMVASKADDVMSSVQSFAAVGAPGWTPALQTALEAHVAAKLQELSQFVGAPTSKGEILSQPVRAFHRSVGIYATNMCR
jgi:hypothetical protein